MAYYHPKTGSEATPNIEYARILDSTSREVRRLVSAENEAPVIPPGVKTLHDLLFKVVLDRRISVEQILSLRASDTTRELPPQTFEGLWKIVFALRLVPGYETVRLYKGKVEEGLVQVPRSKILRHLAKNKLATSSESGASDISLGFHPKDEDDRDDGSSECGAPEAPTAPAMKKKYVFCSSKFYKAEEKKSVDDYDVTNIIAAAKYAGVDDDDFRIVLLVKNKEVVKSKFASAYRRYITYIVKEDEAREGILGREDLEAAITRLRERVGDSPDPEEFIQNTILGPEAPRPFLSLRFHQELLVRKTQQIRSEHDSVLWGVVARGGKTYICGGLIRDIRPQPKHVFIVAGAYTETHTQFLDDLLDVNKGGFQDFHDYTVVDVKNDDFTFDSEKKYIFFISAELLKAFVENKTGKKARERMVMSLVQKRVINPGLVFFDEVHKGGTTSLADDAMSLIAGSAFKVFMTATYNKLFIKDEYHITQDNFLTWGYEDIQVAKGIESEDTLDYFEAKYGKDLCKSVIAAQRARGVSLKDIAAQYQKFPEIQFLTTSFSNKFQESMQKQNILDPAAGFRMNTLLAIGKSCKGVDMKKRYKCFTNPASVAVLINYIAPSTVQLDKIAGKPVVQTASPNENIMNRIGRTSQRRNDILKNVHTEFKPHSQLWFLPQPTVSEDDTPLISLMTALASLLMKHPWYSKHFCIVAVSSGFGRTEVVEYEDGGFIATTDGGMNTKVTVLSLEKKAYSMGRGLLILAGKMLTLGVSLPCVNVVALLDDSQSSDLTYQKMFRALTESEGKNVGYVVDVNPLRTLKTLYDYTKVEHAESDVLEDKVSATVLTNLYLIDEDQLFVTRDDKTRLMPADIHAQIEKYLQAGRKTYKSIVDEASKNISEVDLSEELDKLRADLSAVKPRALELAETLAEVDVPSGVERINDKKKKTAPVAADDTRAKLQALREMILTTMTLLAFLTTFTTIDEALDYYRSNTDSIQDVVYNVLIDRGLTKSADKTKIRDVLIVAISKVQGQLARPYGKMRAKLSDLSGDQKDVIEFIEQNLRPKKEQVAARGEVFTPLTLVEEMLNRLPEDVWRNPEYKFLDPANGIGNFPVVAFAKLDVGLQELFPDAMVRRRHIVENMLYMVELDEANIMLSRRLLEKMCGSPGCRFNLIKHDFLEATDEVLERQFGGVTRFDVIMGNPPYNAGGVAKGGGTIWPRFVRRSFEIVKPNGYITFVHPQGWRKFYDPEDRENQGKIWYSIRNAGWTLRYVNITPRARFESTNVITDYYVIQATAEQGPTQYDTEVSGVQASGESMLRMPFIPNLLSPETVSICEKILSADGVPIQVVYNQSFKPKAEDKEPTGTPHYHFTNKEGERQIYYREYETVPEYVNSPKVIMTSKAGWERGRLFAYYEREPVGVTNNSMYMLANKKLGSKLVEFFNSDIITFLMKITQYSEPPNHINEFKILNQLRMPATMDAYNLTDEEKELIKRVVYPVKTAKPSARLATPRRKKSPNTTQRKKAGDS
jgi:type I restriction-modification system DNA methylase subunit